MVVTIQSVINEHNLIVSKKRLTLDLTFEALEGIPFHNKRIKMDDLVARGFGWALVRINGLDHRHPSTPPVSTDRQVGGMAGRHPQTDHGKSLRGDKFPYAVGS